MQQCLSTLVKLTLHHRALDQQFCFYRIQLSATKVQHYTLLQLIDQHQKALAICWHQNAYWLLTAATSAHPLKTHNQIAFEALPAQVCTDLLIGRLLFMALARLQTPSFTNGLGKSYFYIDIDRFYTHKIYKCVSFDLAYSATFQQFFIQIQGQRFSPASLFEHEPKKSQSAKYRLDTQSALLARDPKGDLVAYGPTNRRSSTYAIDLSAQKTQSLHKSRTGALYRFLQTFNRIFTDLAHIELQTIQASWHQHYGTQDIQKNYQRIYDLLNEQGGIFIVNAAMSTEGYEKLKKIKLPVNMYFDRSTTPHQPTLLLLDSPDQYTQAQITDPKAGYYQKNLLVQGLIQTSLHQSSRPEMLLDACLKELAIKLECMQGKFSIQAMNDKLWFVELEEKKDEAPIFHILKCNQGRLVYEQQHEFYFEDLDIALPQKNHPFEQLHYVLDMSQSPAHVCTIRHEGVMAIPEVGQLFHVLAQLENGQTRGVERSYLESYVLKNTADQTLKEKIIALLTQYPQQTHFFKNDFKTAKISYRSKVEQSFFDDYYEQSGVRLYYSLKSQNNPYLAAFTGHFYDKRYSAFFSGIEKGGFKFNRATFNHLRSLEGPDELKQRCLALTQSYHIRHRQATTLPFPFKHLTECKERAKLLA